jgi:hypothetical protein
VLAQIAADALQIPVDHIAVVQGATRQVQAGHGTFNSRSMPVGASSVKVCADRIVAKAIRTPASSTSSTMSPWTMRARSSTRCSQPARSMAAWRRDGAAFADALHTERVGGRGRLLEVRPDRRQHVGARYRVVEKRAGHQLPGLAVIVHPLVERLADAPRRRSCMPCSTTRFSSTKYSRTSCWWRFTHPARVTSSSRTGEGGPSSADLTLFGPAHRLRARPGIWTLRG